MLKIKINSRVEESTEKIPLLKKVFLKPMPDFRGAHFQQ
jgi:hypothetical protein